MLKITSYSELKQVAAGTAAVINSVMRTVFVKYYSRSLTPEQFSKLLLALAASCNRALRSSKCFDQKDLGKPKRSKDSVSWEELGFNLLFKQKSDSTTIQVILLFRLKIDFCGESFSQRIKLTFPTIILRFLKCHDSIRLGSAAVHQNVDYGVVSILLLPCIRGLSDLQFYKPWSLVWSDMKLGIEQRYGHIWDMVRDRMQVLTFKDFCFVFSAFMQNPLP